MSTIKLTNVKKIYDNKVVAVHDFNLDVADKEFIVFVGPSGCGKSTTLRMIAGLEEISGGTVEIDGVVVNDLPPKDRNIAMVFQNYALYPHLTVFENIAFPLRLIKQSSEAPLTEKEIAAYEKKIAKAKADLAKAEALLADGPRAQKAEEAANAKIAKCNAKIEACKAKIEANKAKMNVNNEDLITAKNQDLELEILKLEKKIAEIANKEQPERHVAFIRAQIEALEKAKSSPKTVYTKMSQDEVYEKVTAVAETLGITDYLMRKPRALSGGQRQRVAIGRAMVRDSKVLLMDEPLSNLDAKLRNQMRAEIILLRKKIDSTFVYVTHDQTEAMTLGDRIVIMKDGFIQQVGSPQQLFDTPANLFVAGFIGAPQMNFWKDAKLASKEGKYSVSIGGVDFPIEGKNGKILADLGVADQEVVLGVRPEHLSFSFKEIPHALKCELIVSEMMGSELHLHLHTEDGSSIIARVPTLGMSEEERASVVPGAVCYVTFGEKSMHLFSKDNGISLLHPEYTYVAND